MRNKLVNLGVLVFSFVVTFGIGEIIVRMLFRDDVVLFPRYHTDVKYGDYTLRRTRPGIEFWHTSKDGKWEFKINNQGFRSDVDFAYEKPEGVTRVLCLGDSHTEGYEVRERFTYSAVIERYLNHNGCQTEVFNTGVSGFSTAEELIFLENEGIKYQPDVVVLGFFMNDLEDNLKADLFKLTEDGRLITTDKRSHIPGVDIQNFIYRMPLVSWLSENSYFYSLLFNNVWVYFKTALGKNASEKVLEFAVPTQTTFSSYETALATELIKRMYNFCTANGIKLIVLDIPMNTGPGKWDSSVPQQMLEAIRGNSDAFVPSDSVLSQYAGVAEVHLPHGHYHISEFAHKLLGVEVAKQICSLIH